jgi:hypothetical protein
MEPTSCSAQGPWPDPATQSSYAAPARPLSTNLSAGCAARGPFCHCHQTIRLWERPTQTCRIVDDTALARHLQALVNSSRAKPKATGRPVRTSKLQMAASLRLSWGAIATGASSARPEAGAGMRNRPLRSPMPLNARTGTNARASTRARTRRSPPAGCCARRWAARIVRTQGTGPIGCRAAGAWLEALLGGTNVELDPCDP